MGPTEEPQLQEEGCYVALTPEPLDVREIMNRVRRADAGAIVMFAGEIRIPKLLRLLLALTSGT